jgi:hypothetical protein
MSSAARIDLQQKRPLAAPARRPAADVGTAGVVAFALDHACDPVVTETKERRRIRRPGRMHPTERLHARGRRASSMR